MRETSQQIRATLSFQLEMKNLSRNDYVELWKTFPRKFSHLDKQYSKNGTYLPRRKIPTTLVR
jgi:hypothetical protein